MEVRPAGAGELERVGQLTVAAYRSVAGSALTAGYEAQLGDAEARAAGADLLVAVDGDEVVGAVTYVGDPASPYSEGFTAGEVGVRMLAVDPAAQGRGAGRALLHACLERAFAGGADRVVLHSMEMMEVARAMYRRAGFTRAPARDLVYDGFRISCFTLDRDRYGGRPSPGGGTGQTRGA